MLQTLSLSHWLPKETLHKAFCICEHLPSNPQHFLALKESKDNYIYVQVAFKMLVVTPGRTETCLSISWGVTFRKRWSPLFFLLILKFVLQKKFEWDVTGMQKCSVLTPLSVSTPIWLSINYPTDVIRMINMCASFHIKKLVLFNINLIETACWKHLKKMSHLTILPIVLFAVHLHYEQQHLNFEQQQQQQNVFKCFHEV